MIVLLVVGLALNPVWWLLVPLGVVLVGATAVVIAAILQMLGEDEDDRSPE